MMLEIFLVFDVNVIIIFVFFFNLFRIRFFFKLMFILIIVWNIELFLIVNGIVVSEYYGVM